MQPFWSVQYGNAGSRTHAFGWEAAAAVERARSEVARAIGASPREIVFTSGATEANNLALLGSVRSVLRQGPRAGRPRVVTVRTEHRAVLDPCAALAREGAEICTVGVDRAGHLDFYELEQVLSEGVLLVSVMHANNEIGVVQDLARIAKLAHARGAYLHSDAAQSVGKLPLDVAATDLDLVSISGHKLYGPKGIGALCVRRRRPAIAIEPLLHGGGQERGLRSGTLPVALCVGLGEACRLAAEESGAEAVRLRELRDRLQRRLSELPEVWINGDLEHRLPGNLNVSFGGIDAEALLLAVPEVALSTGSACTSAKREPSHVLAALGLPRERALGSVRFGLGRSTSAAEVDRAADRLIAEVLRLRALRPRSRRR